MDHSVKRLRPLLVDLAIRNGHLLVELDRSRSRLADQIRRLTQDQVVQVLVVLLVSSPFFNLRPLLVSTNNMIIHE
jgi:hypothetical protein